MEGFNKLQNEEAEKAAKFCEAENHMQGLYYDLLSCLGGGGDNPNLPHGYKQKPMTGFLNIVEAFNDVAKLRSTGSGIILEVGSKDSVGESNLTSSSGETSKARKSGMSSENSQPLQSFFCDDDSQRQSTAASNQSADSNTSYVTTANSTVHFGSSPSEGFTNAEYSDIDLIKSKSHKRDTTETYKSKHDTLEVVERGIPEFIWSGREEGSKVIEVESTEQFFHPDIPEVGPALNTASPLTHMDLTALENQMLKYSDELRRIEQMLKQHLQQQPTPPVVSNVMERSRDDLEHPYLSSRNMVQTLADGIMSPTTALQMMHDIESNESPPYSGSPHMHPASAYESCTSFPTWQVHGSVSGSINRRSADDCIKRTPSLYMECLNLNESGCSDYAHFTSSLDSIRPSFFLPELTPRSNRNHTGGNNNNREENSSHFLSEMVDSFCFAATDVENQNNASYYFVEKESDDQKGFTVVEQGSGEGKERVKTERAKNERKWKVCHGARGDISGKSSEEHLWTSASGSECEEFADEDDGSLKDESIANQQEN